MWSLVPPLPYPSRRIGPALPFAEGVFAILYQDIVECLLHQILHRSILIDGKTL